MSGVVEYIISIVGKVSPDIAKAMQAIGTSAATMTKEVNAAEAALARMGKGQAAAAAHAERTAAKMKNATAEANRWYAIGPAGAAREEAQLKKLMDTQARLDAQAAKLHERAQARLARQNSFWGNSQHGHGEGIMGNAMTAGILGYMGVGMVKGMDHFLDQANAQMMAKQKMAMVGFKGHIMDEADDVATKLSAKYGNVSKTDVLRHLYEGVGIYGSAKESLENAEIQTRLESFLSAFQDGKHAGKGSDIARESMAAIKAMEMDNTLNEHDPAKRKAMVQSFVDGMTGMKVLYGENAKLGEYKTMMQRGSQAVRGMSEDFKRAVLPALIQERGGNVTGTALQTAYQTMIGAVQLSKTQQGELGKYGFLEGSGKDSRVSKALREAFHDPTVAAEMIRNAVAAKMGVDPNSDSGRAALKKEMDGVLGRMWRNRKVSGLFSDLLGGDENIERHRKAMREVLDTMKEIDDVASGKTFSAKTPGGASARMAKQWENLKAELGKPMSGPMLDTKNKIADIFGGAAKGVADFAKQNPALTATMGKLALWGGAAASAAVGAAALGYALKVVGIGIRTLGRFTPLGIGLAIGAGVIANWNALAGAMGRVAAAQDKMKQIGLEHEKLAQKARESAKEPGSFGWWARELMGYHNNELANKERVSQMMHKGDSRRHGMDVLGDVQRRRAALRAASGDDGYTDPMGNSYGGVGGAYSGRGAGGGGPGEKVAAAGAQKVQVESKVNVNTTFGALTITPGTLSVTYNGPINGPAGVPINGSGGQPRGQAMPASSTGGGGGGGGGTAV